MNNLSPQSKRCKFRRFKKTDFNNLRKLESNPDIVKFTSLRIPQTEEQTQQRLQKNLDSQAQLEPLGIWAVETLDGTFIGWSMLMVREFEFPELGYMIVPDHWRQGYASEIAKALVHFGMETLKHKAVSACTDTDNAPSIRVLEKAGFKQVGTKEQPDAVLGSTSTLLVFEKH